MTWDLVDAKVDLYGSLSFVPDIDYWLDPNNTYRVVFVQSQASWFVVTGSDFEIDAHNLGGIQGNGQPWWEYFSSHTKADGDGRPISLTVYRAERGVVRNFAIQAQPFWCNCVAESRDIVYDGMRCNASNTNPSFAGKNIVPNTDGINTYRSDNVSLLHWDVTCGDDCLAIKGVYFKSWDGSINGVPPTGGGGGTGQVRNVVARNINLVGVNLPIHLYQTNGGHSLDLKSTLSFGGLRFENWTGTALANKRERFIFVAVVTANEVRLATVVDIECAVDCNDVEFFSFEIKPPAGQAPRYICQNVTQLVFDMPCNATGLA
ncbi:Glycoside hydrolase family 28 protein [Mycena indigotica]|uniref:galacturonan 1,4-alpha-galacturonidase n=1 Tax=Mycena indigotica TaxID=2126181 RepID=A0A8H6VVA6_9AGAR|nr:Glycoside hydrolase family 28 protein [Mycena indigotica]KAF7295259.1 Glycoside hydrolase family 28 protein [Mycena indigotica]